MDCGTLMRASTETASQCDTMDVAYGRTFPPLDHRPDMLCLHCAWVINYEDGSERAQRSLIDETGVKISFRSV